MGWDGAVSGSDVGGMPGPGCRFGGLPPGPGWGVFSFTCARGLPGRPSLRKRSRALLSRSEEARSRVRTAVRLCRRYTGHLVDGDQAWVAINEARETCLTPLRVRQGPPTFEAAGRTANRRDAEGTASRRGGTSAASLRHGHRDPRADHELPTAPAAKPSRRPPHRTVSSGRQSSARERSTAAHAGVDREHKCRRTPPPPGPAGHHRTSDRRRACHRRQNPAGRRHRERGRRRPTPAP